MSILKTCENCTMHSNEYQNEYCYVCENETEDHDDFIPKEELVREDEKNKILNLLKEDLRDYKTLREEYKDNKNLAIEDTAIISYINDLIDTIEN